MAMEKKKLKAAVHRGQPGLLVLNLLKEFAASGEDLDVLCLPLMVRAGGLLVALPYAAVDQQVLLDGLTDEEFGMIGPNKMMEADNMLAEDDEGNVNKTGRKCRFYVIDFTDDVLMVLRDYDNSQDDMQYILPFDADDPYALPDLQGIVEKVREWASAENMGPRAAFYSARDEPDPIAANGGPPKKAAAKGVSTAALLEKVEALSAQVQLLQGTAQPTTPTAATPAVEQSGGIMLATPKMPRLSDALGRGPGQGVVAKAAALLPPRQRSGVPRASPMAPSPKTMSEDEYTSYDLPQDHMMQTLTQQSSALTALVVHLTTGGDGLSDFGSTSSSSSTGTRGLQHRERLISELAGGSSTFFLQFQQQLYRKMNPTENRRRDSTEPSFSSQLPREEWWIQEPTHPWIGIMDVGLCSGCGRSRRRSYDEGAPGFSSNSHRAMRCRSRRMGTWIPSEPSCRSSCSSLPGPKQHGGHATSDLRWTGPPGLVDNSSGLLANGGAKLEETGPIQKDEECRGRRGDPKPKEKASLPSKTKSKSKSGCTTSGPPKKPEETEHHDEFAACPSESDGSKLPLQIEEKSSRPQTVQLNHSYWCAMLTVMCLRSKTFDFPSNVACLLVSPLLGGEAFIAGRLFNAC